MTTSAKAITTKLSQLAIKASKVMAAGQQEALLPGLKKTTAPKKVLSKKAAINRRRKPATKPVLTKSRELARGKK